MIRLSLAAFFALSASLAIAADSVPIAAAGAGDAMFQFGGFGSFGLAHSSQRLGDYVLDGTQPKGAGRSSNWAIGNDTRFGAQVSAKFDAQFSGVVQVISEYQADNSYRPAVEWANLKYAVTPDAYIRVGRIALPTFLNSDNRKVGHSYPWVHPPVDLYRQLAITNSDGVDAMLRLNLGEAENSIKVIYGQNKLDRPTSLSTSKDMWGVFDTVEYGDATLHVGYQQRKTSAVNFLTGVTGAWTPNSDLSVGVSYDPGEWFVNSSWIQRQSTTKINAMHITGGCRVNDFTPFAVYSQNSPGSFLPGFAAPTAAAIVSANRHQSTVSVGTRWDFMDGADVKVQYDQIRLGANTNGYLANLPAGTILYGTKFHVLSAVVDFVF